MHDQIITVIFIFTPFCVCLYRQDLHYIHHIKNIYVDKSQWLKEYWFTVRMGTARLSQQIHIMPKIYSHWNRN